VRVTVVLTPFVERPNLSITISDSSGVTVAEADVLEPVTPTTELTMHLRPPASRRKHILRVELYYGHDEPQDVLRLSFLPKSES
jgi:type IV secretory pathway ATPase VirB11/archaellum biosynthesis ATPase